MTEANWLYYMRARYYSPELKRFINADVVAGDLSNAVTLNRYAYANCNEVRAYIDKSIIKQKLSNKLANKAIQPLNQEKRFIELCHLVNDLPE